MSYHVGIARPSQLLCFVKLPVYLIYIYPRRFLEPGGIALTPESVNYHRLLLRIHSLVNMITDPPINETAKAQIMPRRRCETYTGNEALKTAANQIRGRPPALADAS